MAIRGASWGRELENWDKCSNWSSDLKTDSSEIKSMNKPKKRESYKMHQKKLPKFLRDG